MRRYGSCQHYVSSSHPVGAACACYAPGRTNQIGFLSINAVACVMPLGDYKSRILFRTCNLFTLLINDGPETTRITGHDSRHAEVVPPFLRSEYDRASTEAVVHVRVKEDCEDRTTQRICGDDSALHKRKRETPVEVLATTGPSKRKPQEVGSLPVDQAFSTRLEWIGRRELLPASQHRHVYVAFGDTNDAEVDVSPLIVEHDGGTLCGLDTLNNVASSDDVLPSLSLDCER